MNKNNHHLHYDYHYHLFRTAAIHAYIPDQTMLPWAAYCRAYMSSIHPPHSRNYNMLGFHKRYVYISPLSKPYIWYYYGVQLFGLIRVGIPLQTLCVTTGDICYTDTLYRDRRDICYKDILYGDRRDICYTDTLYRDRRDICYRHSV